MPSQRVAQPPETASQHVIEELRRSIVAGDLRPGQRVGQEEIAERCGVSLAPVREALTALEQEGQLTYKPRRGYFVTELALTDLLEIYELRALLEDRAARSALAHIDAETLYRIELANRDCCDAADSGDVAAELEANRRFHFALLETAGQTHAMRLIRLLWDSTETYRAMYYNAAGWRAESLRSHERIVEALRAGNADDLVFELDAHRRLALDRLSDTLA